MSGRRPAVRRHLFFGGWVLAVTIASAGVLARLYRFSEADASASHVVLIPFVSLVLGWISRERIFADVRREAAAGGALAAAGLLVWGAGLVNGSLPLSVAGMVVLVFGGFLLAYGRTSFRAALFPLMFLLFMIPFPAMVLAGATALLKRGSTEVVAALFTLTGTTYHREGFVFALRDVAIEVADQCSGIRSSIALTLTALIAGQMFLRSPWKRALLVAAIFPVTIIKNGIRIVGLTLLAMHVDPGFLTGELHREGGIFFFLLALVLLAPLLKLLRRSEVRRSTSPVQPQSI